MFLTFIGVHHHRRHHFLVVLGVLLHLVIIRIGPWWWDGQQVSNVVWRVVTIGASIWDVLIKSGQIAVKKLGYWGQKGGMSIRVAYFLLVVRFKDARHHLCL